MSNLDQNVPTLKEIPFGPEARAAELYTEFEVGARQFSITALGKRACSVDSASFDERHGTLAYKLNCTTTWFETEHKELGPVRIFQDPRIEEPGWIYARRNRDGSYVTPFLSVFNQHLIFHVGDNYFYYPRHWQVVASITHWPPEYHQYHHLEDKTPVFDLLTRRPNVAVKGVSTVTILGQLSKEEDARIEAACKAEIEKFNELPGTKMTPEDLTPAQ
jgi:hypothetical protein